MSRPEAAFSPRAVRWLAGLGVGSFATLLALLAWGPDLAGTPSAGTDSYSLSALGHHALAAFLRESGLRVIAARSRPADRAGPGAPLLLAEPDPDRGPSLAGRLRELAARDATGLIVLPKWKGEASGARRGWVEDVRLRPLEEVQRVWSGLPVEKGGRVTRDGARSGPLAVETAWGERMEVVLLGPQLLSRADGLEPVAWCAQGLLIARADVPGRPYVVSDPDLLSNHGLPRGDNAVLVHRLFVRRLEAQAVVIDETLHGHQRETSLARELADFPLVLGTLHGLVVLALALWAGMGRFGQPLPDAPPLGAGRLVLLENTARLLLHGAHTRHSLVRYFDQTVRAVADALQLPPELPAAQRRARVGELSLRRGVEIDLEGIAARIRELDHEGARAPGSALALAAHLHRWRAELTLGTRAGGGGHGLRSRA